MVTVVVATTDTDLSRVRGRLGELFSGSVRIAAPSAARRLVLAAVDDDREAERLASSLRAEGMPAVARPDGGVRLDAWRRDTRPATFGEQLAVCFAWSEHERADLPAVVELGAGGFGSGRHPTTRLLIEHLVERITGGERVLDIGCGSGVLGLCALQLGASCVVAVDVKPDAVEATRRNAALNGMEQRVDATSAKLADIEGTFDVVVANVGRAAIVELAPQLVAHLSARGWLGVSGISPSQCSLVAGFLHPLVEFERRTDGDWSSALLGSRDGAHCARAIRLQDLSVPARVCE
jgi:ribosomal protein L11 methyltransferase